MEEKNMQTSPLSSAEEAEYRQRYYWECEKNDVLTERLEDAERRAADLEFRMGRIKNSLFWKLTYPARGFMYLCRDHVIRKLRNRKLRRKAMRQHGRASFPDAAERRRQEETVFPRDITFSILVPLYNTPEKFLREMLASVQAQTYAKWELCLADGSDAEHAFVGAICQDATKVDARIRYQKLEKNLGISENTNACLSMASGEYIGLFDHDDILHPAVLWEYMQAICNQNADFLYCDEVTFEGDSIDRMISTNFKPDFAPDNLRANNYICHFSVFSRELINKTGAFRPAFDGAQDHDLILRLTMQAQKIVHVPKLLYYWRSHPQSTAADIGSKSYAIDAAKQAVQEHLLACGLEGTVESTRAFPTIFRIKYSLKSRPLVSLVIADGGQPEVLKRCLDSLKEKTAYENYEILVAAYDGQKSGENTENSSHALNLAVKRAQGDFVLLLHSDTEVIRRMWLDELLMYAEREDVGAVGAKLYDAAQRIQHAGMVLGIGPDHTAGYIHQGMKKEELGYMGRLCYAQNMTAVSAACLLVRKSLYEKAGGFDEALAGELAAVDFCLRLRELGCLNLFTPFCELRHYDTDEKLAAASEQTEYFKKKWKRELEAGDPYYNPNFSPDSTAFALKL